MKVIAVVDDDPGVREAIQYVFNAGHYQINTYPDGTGILKNEYPVPDLYILDKQLPGVDGLEVCRFLKGQEKTMHVPVIIVSASPDIGRMATIAGADDALEKPFRVNELRAIVNKHLEGQSK